MGITFTHRPPLEIGNKYNRWTVLEAPDIESSREVWLMPILCRCECGKEFQVKVRHLLLDMSKQCRSCSTSQNVRKHGASDSGKSKKADRLYRIWKAIKWRCNPKNPDGKSVYWSRGITVCKRWSKSYVVFRDWALLNGYQEHLTIDRINNESGYYPENCRWSTYKEQAANRRTPRRCLTLQYQQTQS